MPDSTLTSNIRRHPSSSMSKAGSALKTPTLLIRTSTRGTRSKICCAPALVPTSAVMPRAPSSAATASTRAASNPFTMTSAPARPSISAIALPIPAVEPVTSAMRPVRSIFISSFPDPFLAVGAVEFSSSGEVSSDRRFLPSIEVATEGFEFLPTHSERVIAEEQVQRGIGGFEHLDDRIGGANGIAWLFATQLTQLAASRAGRRGVVGDLNGCIVRGRAGPVGAETARLDERHLDPQRPDLHRQALGQPFNRELGCAVVSETRECRQPGYGGQVDDVPAPALPHSGQHRVRHLCQAEKIDVQNPVDLLLLALLDCGEVADAGVVHQDVDAAEVLVGATHSLRDLGGVGDVQPQRERAIFMPGDEVFDLLEVGGRHRHTISTGQHDSSELATEPGRTAGNEPRPWTLLAHL